MHLCNYNGWATNLTGPPSLGLWLQQFLDEVFGVVANVLPVLLVEDHVGRAALVDELL
jgi:hypothetical protein